jgi:hypothetical protein
VIMKKTLLASFSAATLTCLTLLRKLRSRPAAQTPLATGPQSPKAVYCSVHKMSVRLSENCPLVAFSFVPQVKEDAYLDGALVVKKISHTRDLTELRVFNGKAAHYRVTLTLHTLANFRPQKRASPWVDIVPRNVEKYVSLSVFFFVASLLSLTHCWCS